MDVDEVIGERGWGGQLESIVGAVLREEPRLPVFKIPYDHPAASTGWPELEKQCMLLDSEIRLMWDTKRREAANSGTWTHAMLEFLFNGYQVMPGNMTGELDAAVALIHQLGNVEVYRTEWCIYASREDVAGSIDLVLKSSEDETFYLVDWKRSEKLQVKYNGFDRYMNPPLQNIADCHGYHSRLQLNMYKWILQTYYGIKVLAVKVVCVHPRYLPGGFVDDVLDLQEEVGKLTQCLRDHRLARAPPTELADMQPFAVELPSQRSHPDDREQWLEEIMDEEENVVPAAAKKRRLIPGVDTHVLRFQNLVARSHTILSDTRDALAKDVCSLPNSILHNANEMLRQLQQNFLNISDEIRRLILVAAHLVEGKISDKPMLADAAVLTWMVGSRHMRVRRGYLQTNETRDNSKKPKQLQQLSWQIYRRLNRSRSKNFCQLVVQLPTDDCGVRYILPDWMKQMQSRLQLCIKKFRPRDPGTRLDIADKCWKLSGTVGLELMQTRMISLLVEWCETEDQRAASVCYDDVCFVSPLSESPVQVARLPSPLPNGDATWTGASSEYLLAAWVRACTLLHLSEMYKHNHVYFDPNIWYLDEELRKQVETFARPFITTGQEAPESNKKLHIDLYKKIISADGIMGRRQSTFNSMVRRALVWTAKAHFIHKKFLTAYEDHQLDGIFEADPSLNKFLTTSQASMGIRKRPQQGGLANMLEADADSEAERPEKDTTWDNLPEYIMHQMLDKGLESMAFYEFKKLRLTCPCIKTHPLQSEEAKSPSPCFGAATGWFRAARLKRIQRLLRKACVGVAKKRNLVDALLQEAEAPKYADFQAVQLEELELLQALKRLGGNKALPSIFAPASLWKLAPQQVVPALLPTMNQASTCMDPSWHDVQLHLIAITNHGHPIMQAGANEAKTLSPRERCAITIHGYPITQACANETNQCAFLEEEQTCLATPKEWCAITNAMREVKFSRYASFVEDVMASGTQPAYTEYYHASTAVPADFDPGNNTYGYPLATNRMLNYRNKVLSLDNKNPKKKHVIKEITPADVINVTSYLKKTNAYSEFYKNRRKGRSLEPVVSYVVRTCFEKEVAQESDLHQRIEVILDSGADDAQGKAIKTEGRRMLNLTFFDDNGSFCRIQEAFTVASVINPLMAIGKLFREGWELRVNEEEGMCLTDGNSRIPVHLHKNSLAAYAYVQTPSRSRGYSSSNYKMVRTVVQLNKHVQEAVNKEEPGWHNTDSMVIVKYATQSSYENPSLMYSPTHFPYRSTLVKEERGWRAVEVSRKYSEKADPFEEFGEGEKEVVTAISAKPIPLWILGTPYAAGDRADQESHGRDYWKMDLEKGEVVRHHVVPRTALFDPTGVSNCPVLLGDLENSRYTDIPKETVSTVQKSTNIATTGEQTAYLYVNTFGYRVVEDLKAEAAAEELKKKKEEHYQRKEDSAAPPAAEEIKDEEMREAQADQEAPQEVVEVLEESFYHEGVEYTAQRSSLKELQALCREYGVKTTGSKKQLLKRLATAVREERLNTQHKEQREHHQAYHLAPPQEPTEEERAYHNLTHLPYQPWCPHCVAMKAREDNHKKGLSKPSSSTDSAKPVISFDFCYTSTTGSEEPPAVTLVAVDSWSKAVLAVPCKRKGGAGSTTHLAEALVQFTTKNVNSSRTTRLMMTPFWRNSEQVNHSQPQQEHLQHQLNQVNRAEETDGYLNMPHDDEVYEADDEFLYESEEEEETESEPTEVFTKVPVEFFDEEKGPPNVDPDFLQKLDDEATVKEIKRLTKMGVISLVSTDPQEATENVPLVDSEQELHKWLTTKLVKDWRFREATGFEVDEATAGTTKPKQIQRITKLVPMLALANNWAIYSVDVKEELESKSEKKKKKHKWQLTYNTYLSPSSPGSMSLLEVLVTLAMVCMAAYFVVNEMRKPQKHKKSKKEVNYDVDSFDEAKKEVTEKAEKLKKVEESLEKEKEEFGNQKAEFEETVKRFLKKQKEVKEKEDKVTEREEKLEKDQETLQEQAKALSEKETALEEAEENVKAKEAEVEKKNKEAEKRERKAQERTVGYDQEREEYAKKYVDDVKKDLERELKVLKQEEKVRNQKLDDLQYDYKSLKDDYQYFKTYSQEVDALLLAAKDRIVKYKKKAKSLKETIGAVLSGSEGEEETDEAYKTKAEEEKEKAEAKAKEEEKKKGKKPKQVETEDPEEKPSSNQGDENTFDPNDIAEFTQLGYVWEFNKKTQEYRAKSEDKKGSTRIKNAPVKGRLLWNKVTECYRRHNVWFTDGKELDKFLETKENEKIEEEVQRRIHAKGKYDNQGMKGKGPSWDDGQNDSWWYNEQWNNENWNTTDDGSNWYENANPQNKGYWQTPEEWAQQNQWEQWTPKGKSKGKKSKNWVQTQ
ncbi:GIP [Symbiodinium sp. CCMP2592]|nr:GIP [Symbiodinium sp. CCMP2592]